MEIHKLDTSCDPFILMLECKTVDNGFIDLYTNKELIPKLDNGLIEPWNLHLIISEEPQQHPFDPQERLISLQSEKELKVDKKLLHWEINDKDQEILRRYFINRDKPKLIARKTKVSKEYVYNLVEKIKKVLIKTISSNSSSKLDLIEHKKTFEEEIKIYWTKQEHTQFTVSNVHWYLASKFNYLKVPSKSWIIKIMKNSLNLRYKQVSSRPMKNKSNELITQRLDYIKFVNFANENNLKIIQIDEFIINRETAIKRGWIQKGEESWVMRHNQTTKFWWIAAISNWWLELLWISKENTNSKLFVKFLTLLTKRITAKYKDSIEMIIFVWDGAPYHCTNQIKRFLRRKKILMIRTIPYTPEFSPIEIFINCLKSKLKAERVDISLRLIRKWLEQIDEESYSRFYEIWQKNMLRFKAKYEKDLVT